MPDVSALQHGFQHPLRLSVDTHFMSDETRQRLLETPDGRYLVIRGRLWRRSDPMLLPETREHLVADLMRARRAKKTALATEDAAAVKQAREMVDAAKRALGERGPVWWHDGAPDENRTLAKNSSYAMWYASLSSYDG